MVRRWVFILIWTALPFLGLPVVFTAVTMVVITGMALAGAQVDESGFGQIFMFGASVVTGINFLLTASVFAAAVHGLLPGTRDGPYERPLSRSERREIRLGRDPLVTPGRAAEGERGS